MVELQRAAYAVEAELIGFDGIPPLHDSAADVRGFDLVWLGAFEGETLVGGLGYVDNPGLRDIDRLFVDPSEARRGIGRALVTAALGAGQVQVSTGTGNGPARHLYESLGFEETGVRPIAPGVTVTRFVYKG